jgi:branched-chain amino acid transport system substrate-binding protein
MKIKILNKSKKIVRTSLLIASCLIAVFGVPAKQGAQIVIDAINNGTMPAPYNTKGFAGAKLNPIFSDESGGGTKQVGLFRDFVEKQKVDAMIGYISSGNCMAIGPIADELKMLTVFSTCGTPRLFEEKLRTHVFRTQANAVGDSLAAALYIKDMYPNEKNYTGINQNYAWGLDSYKFFELGMKALSPDSKGSDKPQFPKLFVGQYGTEISALSLDKAKVVHSSFWDGDIEAFTLQAMVRGFFQKKIFISSVVGSAVDAIGSKFPNGIIMGTRGNVGLLARDNKNPLNVWFIKEYKKRFKALPLGPSYQYARSILAYKYAMDKAKAKAGSFPSQDQVIAAMENIKFKSFTETISMARGGGHQSVHSVGYGLTKYDKKGKTPGIEKVKMYGPECIYPPAGTNSEAWINAGMPGAKCN